MSALHWDLYIMLWDCTCNDLFIGIQANSMCNRRGQWGPAAGGSDHYKSEVSWLCSSMRISLISISSMNNTQIQYKKYITDIIYTQENNIIRDNYY